MTGVYGGKTTVPILVNITTGDMIGYAKELPFGQRLEINAKPGADDTAVATLNGVDVSARLFSLRGFQLGVPFTAPSWTRSRVAARGTRQQRLDISRYRSVRHQRP